MDRQVGKTLDRAGGAKWVTMRSCRVNTPLNAADAWSPDMTILWMESFCFARCRMRSSIVFFDTRRYTVT